MTNTHSIEVFAPGEFIRDELEARGWTQADLAGIMNRPIQLVNLIIGGKKAITAQTAQELGAAFGTGPEVWMNLQSAYSLSMATGSQEDIAARASLYQFAPVKVMESRGWIAKTATIAELKKELARFYGTSKLDSLPPLRIAARTSAEPIGDAGAAQTCWGYRVKQLAMSLHVAEFSKDKLRSGIPNLRRLATCPEEARKVPRVLAEMGIRFVVVEHLPKSKIDGAVMSIGHSPAIGLSLRYDRIDYFWHTLIHELDHLLHDEPIMDVNMDGVIDDPETAAVEARADSEAANMLIPREQLNSFITRVGPLYSKDRINRFANRIGIHPGIIVGQLQYRKEIPYSANREMLAQVREIVIQEALTDGWGKTVGTWIGETRNANKED